MISFQNVTKTFGDFTAIENISFGVEPGSIYGLIGYNGAGKTTLLKTAAGIYKSDGGGVFIDKENTFDNPNIRKKMFYVPDDLYFPMHASIHSMAKFYADYYPQFSQKTLQNLLDVFGLDAKKKIRGFSKGMQRQAEIILALSTRPKYLLLDETFDGLDPQKKETTKKLFMEYIAESDCSLIISSHSLPELSDLCDHVGLINGKHLALNGSVYDLQDRYKKYRLTFDKAAEKDWFQAISYQSIEITGSSAVLIFDTADGSEMDALKALHPTSLEAYPLTIEEIFLNEMGEKEYDITKIFEE